MNLVSHRLLILHNLMRDIDEINAAMGKLIQQREIQRERKQRRRWVKPCQSLKGLLINIQIHYTGLCQFFPLTLSLVLIDSFFSFPFLQFNILPCNVPSHGQFKFA